ncbi:MAG TPA: sigma-70 family RNA polymerase sigma factor [Verrucomicrobiae bacterium]|nr:sigma-70 family RNA polymerase sigma factor [Verrucomicrobiae bacterium]
MSEVTRILQDIGEGNSQAAEKLLPLVYDELRKLAAARMAKEPAGLTLQPTALVHEAWLRLGGSDGQIWTGRSHFFAAAAEAMRRILIESARRRKALRHGGGQVRVDVQDVELAAPAPDDQLLVIDEALSRFAAIDPRKAELVKLRYFIGMTIQEAADGLNISEATAKRWWDYAKAWLFSELRTTA